MDPKLLSKQQHVIVWDDVRGVVQRYAFWDELSF